MGGAKAGGEERGMCEGETRIGEAGEERMESCCLHKRGGAERA